MNHGQRLKKRFDDWFHNRTPAETELHRMAIDFEERHFSDLRLVAPPIKRRLFGYKEEADDGQLLNVVDDVNGSKGISIYEWIFRFRRSSEWIGLCEPKHRTISIQPGLKNVEHRATHFCMR